MDARRSSRKPKTGGSVQNQRANAWQVQALSLALKLSVFCASQDRLVAQIVHFSRGGGSPRFLDHLGHAMSTLFDPMLIVHNAYDEDAGISGAKAQPENGAGLAYPTLNPMDGLHHMQLTASTARRLRGQDKSPDCWSRIAPGFSHILVETPMAAADPHVLSISAACNVSVIAVQAGQTLLTEIRTGSALVKRFGGSLAGIFLVDAH